MEIITFNIEGLLLYKPQVFTDERGYFYESFNQKKFNEAIGRDVKFVQDNQSLSQKGTVRGLHFQAPPHAQGKLVNVVQGEVLDFVVDIRKNSPTYGQSQQVKLTAEEAAFLFVPAGFAHGFYTLKDHTIFQYKCTNYYHKNSEGAIKWSDQSFDFYKVVNKPIVSSKDQEAPNFKDFKSPF